MSGSFGDHIRSLNWKLWSDRVDVDGLARYLRSVHPDKTAAHVAADTGFSHDTVRKWLSGESTPNMKAFLVLLCAYGPQLAHSMLKSAPDWLDASCRAEAQAKLRNDLAAIQRELDRIGDS